MRVLSLFSGLGAHDLGLQNAGMQIVGQCEIDPFCLLVLAKHWPDVPRFTDIKYVTGDAVRERCGRVDLICAGFPCQDISVAGRGAGLGTSENPTKRSGLFWELLRVIREVRPVYLVLENVPALRTRGADIVLDALDREGYPCEANVVGAEHAGAPHRRHRVWIVGRRVGDADVPGTTRFPGIDRTTEATQKRLWTGTGVAGVDVDHPTSTRRTGDTGCQPSRSIRNGPRGTEPAGPCGGSDSMAHATGERERELADEADAIAVAGRSRDESGDGSELADAASGGQRADGEPRRDAGHADECGTNMADATRDGERGPSPAQRADGMRTGACGDGELADSQRLAGFGGEREPVGQSQGGTAAGGSGEGTAAGLGQAESGGEGLAGRRGLSVRTGSQVAVPAGGGNDRKPIRWPSRPGQPQHEWESPRLSEFQVGVPAPGIAGRLVRVIADRLGLTVEEAEAWWVRNHVKLDRIHSKHALKAIGNANPPIVVEAIGRAILATVNGSPAHLESIPDAAWQAGPVWPTPQCFDLIDCVRSPDAMQAALSRPRGAPGNLREFVLRV